MLNQPDTCMTLEIKGTEYKLTPYTLLATYFRSFGKNMNSIPRKKKGMMFLTAKKVLEHLRYFKWTDVEIEYFTQMFAKDVNARTGFRPFLFFYGVAKQINYPPCAKSASDRSNVGEYEVWIETEIKRLNNLK